LLAWTTQTGLTIFEGFTPSQNLRDFCHSLKFRMLEDMDEFYNICKSSGVSLYPITGEKGLTWAIVAIGFFDQVEFAAKLPSQCV